MFQADPVVAGLLLGFLIFICLGWGPGTHLWGALQVIEHCRNEKNKSKGAGLILQHTDPFLYGAIAADLISFKRFGGLKNHCHNWNMKERMAPLLRSPEAEAFALGYLCHLAADIGSHNFFVPYHRLVDLPPPVLGHAYWESRADATLEEHHWELIEDLRQRESFRAFDEIIDRAVEIKALSISSNRLIFRTLVLAQGSPAWRKARRMLQKRPNRRELNTELLQILKRKMILDMLSVVHDKNWRTLLAQDPLGRIPLRAARVLRRQLLVQYGNREAALPVARRLARDCFWPPENIS